MTANKRTGLSTLKGAAYLVGGIALLLLSLNVMWLIHGDEDHTFDQQRREAMKAADRIFIANNLCSTENNCDGKGMLLYRPYTLGFGIEMYGITDRSLLRQVAEIFVQTFFNTPDIVRLDVRAYPLSHQQDMELPMWTHQERLLDIELKRRK